MQEYKDLMSEDKLRYEADIYAINWIILVIPNDIYNSVDACQTAEQMWKRVQRNDRNQARNVVNQGVTVRNGIVQTTTGNAKNLQRNLRNIANVGKASIV
nr:hypothetical protein [Tanacetum cinerariifolium]GEZ01970.1 hypothetical protein [Tanacetum cinerariifolium]